MKRLITALLFLIYILGIFFILFILMEIAARSFYSSTPPLKERERFCVYDPEIGWRNKPGASGNLQSQDFNVQIQINSQGLREEEEFSLEKPAGIYRIAILGDSFTWGFGVEAHETYAKLLEKEIKGTQVLNFGCSGYGQDQSYLLVKKQVLLYKPDLILVMIHTASDFENNASFFQYGFYKPLFTFRNEQLVLENVPVPHPTLGTKLNAWLFERSVLWRLLGSRKMGPIDLMAAGAAALDQKGELIQKSFQNGPAVNLTCSLSQSLQNAAKQAQAEILFILAPPLQTLERGNKNRILDDDRYEKLRECLSAHSLKFIDMKTVFEKRLHAQPNDLLTFVHDAHWNKEGHRLIAHALRDYLLSDPDFKTKTIAKDKPL